MERIKLTGLWKNTSRRGETYYGGSLSPGVRLLMFKNNFKENENDPDLVIYIARSEPKPDKSTSSNSSVADDF